MCAGYKPSRTTHGANGTSSERLSFGALLRIWRNRGSEVPATTPGPTQRGTTDSRRVVARSAHLRRPHPGKRVLDHPVRCRLTGNRVRLRVTPEVTQTSSALARRRRALRFLVGRSAIECSRPNCSTSRRPYGHHFELKLGEQPTDLLEPVP